MQIGAEAGTQLTLRMGGTGLGPRRDNDRRRVAGAQRELATFGRQPGPDGRVGVAHQPGSAVGQRLGQL